MYGIFTYIYHKKSTKCRYTVYVYQSMDGMGMVFHDLRVNIYPYHLISTHVSKENVACCRAARGDALEFLQENRLEKIMAAAAKR